MQKVCIVVCIVFLGSDSGRHYNDPRTYWASEHRVDSLFTRLTMAVENDNSRQDL